MQTVGETNIPDYTLLKRGKVRDIYLLDEKKLLIVSTDRISAFDFVLHNLIPFKGYVLNKISVYWFKKMPFPSHFITDELPESFDSVTRNLLRGRSMVVKRTDVLPVECIVRGYLAGSALREYKKHGTAGGIKLPQGLKEYARLPEPIFTPTTKEETDHDRPISFEDLCNILGKETAFFLRERSIELYNFGHKEALKKNIIIADTKFEFGIDENGDIIIIDEVFTPDSSRYWDRELWEKGNVYDMDKEFVRKYLLSSGWDREQPPPPLPPEIVENTSRRYLDILKRLTGESPNFNHITSS